MILIHSITNWSLINKVKLRIANFNHLMVQGPCTSGQLFIAGQCICNTNLTMHFHEEKQECYQLYTQGPCSNGQMMTFNYHTRKPQCVCRDEHVLSHDGQCYQVNTVGPCNQTACPPVNSFSYPKLLSFVWSSFHIIIPSSFIVFDVGFIYEAHFTNVDISSVVDLQPLQLGLHYMLLSCSSAYNQIMPMHSFKSKYSSVSFDEIGLVRTRDLTG